MAIKVIDKKLAAAKAKKAAESAAKRAEQAAKKDAASSAKSKTGERTGEASHAPGQDGRQTSTDDVKRKLRNGAGTPQNGTSPSHSARSRATNGAKSAEEEPATQSTFEAPTFLKQLSTEVQLLMRLDHPNIIRLFQVIESEDECYVIMEYASGGELIDTLDPSIPLRKGISTLFSTARFCH